MNTQEKKSRPGCCSIQNGPAVEIRTLTQFHRPYSTTQKGVAQ